MQNSFSRIIAGVMQWGQWGADLSAEAMSKLISQCVDSGVTSFDHADIYGNYTTEATFGEALKLSGIQRDKIQLISKCGICMPCDQRPQYQIKSYNTSTQHIIQSVEQSLTNLKTDHLDLLLIHRPSPLMHAEQIAEAVTTLKESGKILEFGVSNFNPGQMSLLQSATTITANQIELSLLNTDPLTDGTLDYCQEYKILPMIWSPLAGGKLFKPLENPEIEKTKTAILKVCQKYGWTIDQTAYLFILHHPYKMYPVTGSSNINRIRLAVSCLDIPFSDQKWFEIYEATQGKRVP